MLRLCTEASHQQMSNATMIEKSRVRLCLQVNVLWERSRVNYSRVRLLLWWWHAVINEIQAGGVNGSSEGRGQVTAADSVSHSLSRDSHPAPHHHICLFYSCTLSSGNTDGLNLGAVSIFHKFLDRYNIRSVWKTQYIWFYGAHSRWRIYRTALLHTVMSTACWEACANGIMQPEMFRHEQRIFQNGCVSFVLHFLFVSCKKQYVDRT